MKSVVYLGCPTEERADTERLLAAADVSVVSGPRTLHTVATPPPPNLEDARVGPDGRRAEIKLDELDALDLFGRRHT